MLNKPMNDSLLKDLEKRYLVESGERSEVKYSEVDSRLPDDANFDKTNAKLENAKTADERAKAYPTFQKEFVQNAVIKRLKELGVKDNGVIEQRLEDLGLTDERVDDDKVDYKAFMQTLREKCGVQEAEEEPLEDEEETSGTGQYPPVENPEGEEEDASAVEAVEPAPQDGAEPELVTYPFEKTRYSEKSSFDKNRDNWIESKMMLLRKRGILP